MLLSASKKSVSEGQAESLFLILNTCRCHEISAVLPAGENTPIVIQPQASNGTSGLSSVSEWNSGQLGQHSTEISAMSLIECVFKLFEQFFPALPNKSNVIVLNRFSPGASDFVWTNIKFIVTCTVIMQDVKSHAYQRFLYNPFCFSAAL